MDTYTALNCLVNLMSGQVQPLHAVGLQIENPSFKKKKKKKKRMRKNGGNSTAEFNPANNKNNGSNKNKYPSLNNKNKSNENKRFINTHLSKSSGVFSTDNLNKTLNLKNKGSSNMNTKQNLQNIKKGNNVKTNPNLKNKKKDSSVNTQASIYPKGLFKKDPKVCTICNKHFSGLKQATEHYGSKKHKTEFELYKLQSVPFIQCKFCEKKFYMKKMYKRHLYNHRRMKMVAEKREKNTESENLAFSTNNIGGCIPVSTNSCLKENIEHFPSIGSTDLEVSSLNIEPASFTSILNHTEKELFEISRQCIVMYLTKDADPVLGMMVERAPIFTSSDGIDLLEKAIKYVVLDSLSCSFCKKIFGSIELCEMHLVSTSHDENVAKAKTLLINGTFAYQEEWKNCTKMKSTLDLAGSSSAVPVRKHGNGNLPFSFQIFPQGEENNGQRNGITIQQHEYISRQVPKPEGKNLPFCFEMNLRELKEDIVTSNHFGEILGKKERKRVNSESSNHSDVNARLFQIAHQNLLQENMQRHQNLSDSFDKDEDPEALLSCSTDRGVTIGSKNDLCSSNQHKFNKNSAQRNCMAVQMPGHVQRLATPKIEQVCLSLPPPRNPEMFMANIVPQRHFVDIPIRKIEEPNHVYNETLQPSNVNSRLFQIAHQNLSSKFDSDYLSSNSFDDIALEPNSKFPNSSHHYNIKENNVKINPMSVQLSKDISRIPPKTERELHYETKPHKLSKVAIAEFEHFKDMSSRRSNISEPVFNESQNQSNVNARLIHLAHQNFSPAENVERNRNFSGNGDPNHFLVSASECSKLKPYFKNSSCSSYDPEEFQSDRHNPYRREKELLITSSNFNRADQSNKRYFQVDCFKNKEICGRQRDTDHYKDELPFSDIYGDSYRNQNCRSLDQHTNHDEYHVSQNRCLSNCRSQNSECKAVAKKHCKFCEGQPSGNFKQNKSSSHSPEITETIPHYTVHFTG